MSARQMPMWYAQPRGTAITALAVLDDDHEEQGFFPTLGDRLANLVDGGPAAAIGFLVVLTILSAIPGAFAATDVALAVLLASIPLIWCAASAIAGMLAYTEGEEAPAWAAGLVSFMTIVGKMAAAVFVVTTVIALIAMVVALLFGISSMGRERW